MHMQKTSGHLPQAHLARLMMIRTLFGLPSFGTHYWQKMCDLSESSPRHFEYEPLICRGRQRRNRGCRRRIARDTSRASDWHCHGYQRTIQNSISYLESNYIEWEQNDSSCYCWWAKILLPWFSSNSLQAKLWNIAHQSSEQLHGMQLTSRCSECNEECFQIMLYENLCLDFFPFSSNHPPQESLKHLGHIPFSWFRIFI